MPSRYAVWSALALLAVLLGAMGAPRTLAHLSATPAHSLALIGTGFTYQGQLKNGSTPVNGSCEVAFRLYDALTNGNVIGNPLTTTVSVSNGLFTTQLDFGPNVFDGNARWLDLRVKCGSDVGFTQLAPRQALTAAPYALALPGLYTQPNITSTNLIGGYAGNWVALGAVGAVIAGGGSADYTNTVTANFGTVSGGEGNQADDYGTVGGGGLNSAANFGATVGGGAFNEANGIYSTIGGGQTNVTENVWTTIGGGLSNTVQSSGDTIGGGQGNRTSGGYATIAGGFNNTANGLYAVVGGGRAITASNAYASVGGGYGNVASGAGAVVGGGGWNGMVANGNRANATGATIAGGYGNVITTAASYAAIGGGTGNSIQSTGGTIAGGNTNVLTVGGMNSFIGGGSTNTISGPHGVVGGGQGNTVETSSYWGTVGGGSGNTVRGFFSVVGGGSNNAANGAYATVPGGNGNAATGSSSLAAGTNAQALHAGVFMWADSTNAPISSTIANQFLIRASGGVTLYTDAGATTGAALYPGSGAWTSASDRNLKTNFSPVDGRAILAQVAALPIQTWNYTAQPAAIRHIGPTAQDFAAAFAVGETNTGISVVDADGVALAAIQGLHEISTEQSAELAALRAENTALAARLSALEQAQTAPIFVLGVFLGIGICLGVGRRLSIAKYFR